MTTQEVGESAESYATKPPLAALCGRPKGVKGGGVFFTAARWHSDDSAHIPDIISGDPFVSNTVRTPWNRYSPETVWENGYA